MYVYYVLTRCDGMRSESRFRSSIRTARRHRSAPTTRTVREATEHAMFDNSAKAWHAINRRHFIGGSDVRIIMGGDEAALLRLWREKRGEAEPEDLSSNLVVQLGAATEELNRRWYERTTGEVIKDVQSWVRHPVIRWMAATLDGVVESTGAVF